MIHSAFAPSRSTASGTARASSAADANAMKTSPAPTAGVSRQAAASTRQRRAGMVSLFLRTAAIHRDAGAIQRDDRHDHRGFRGEEQSGHEARRSDEDRQERPAGRGAEQAAGRPCSRSTARRVIGAVKRNWTSALVNRSAAATGNIHALPSISVATPTAIIRARAPSTAKSPSVPDARPPEHHRADVQHEAQRNQEVARLTQPPEPDARTLLRIEQTVR